MDHGPHRCSIVSKSADDLKQYCALSGASTGRLFTLPLSISRYSGAMISLGDVESASLLMTFITMREQECCEGTPAQLSPDFVGALFSVQNLLEAFKSRGDAMVHRMMALEVGDASAVGKAVR